MKIELHLLQNVAPACLNRDDTNTPKDCEFGGVRRARISSQCLKRAVRTDSLFEEKFEGEIGIRSKNLASELAKQLLKKDEQKNGDEAKVIAAEFLSATKLSKLEKGGTKTATLLHLSREEIERLETLLTENYPSLLEAKKKSDALKADNKEKQKRAREKEAEQASGSSDEVEEEEEEEEDDDDKKEAKDPLKVACLGIAKKFRTKRGAVDIALFGRMFAKKTKDPDDDINAACQVAHAISTNKVSMEMDFYTAVDDLQGDGETGAGMMGFTGFNSSCFYRYAVIDLKQLVKNLNDDRELAQKAVEAFIRASVTALPTGKQNSMAAHNPPDAIFAVVRENGAPVSLANAFAKSVKPSHDADLMQESIKRLDDYWGRLAKVYDNEGGAKKAICLVPEVELTNLKESKKDSLSDVMKIVTDALQKSANGGQA